MKKKLNSQNLKNVTGGVVTREDEVSRDLNIVPSQSDIATREDQNALPPDIHHAGKINHGH